MKFYVEIPRDVKDYYRGRNVAVTGSSGFLGTAICNLLSECGASVERVSLRNGPTTIFSDLVFHLAAKVSGISGNKLYPFWHLEKNTQITLDLCRSLEQRHTVIAAGSVCAYPKYVPTPTSESNFWNGMPEETNLAYGIAKRHLYVALRSRYEEGKLRNYAYLILANMYGPHDHFESEHCHVIPALIKKVYNAKEKGGPVLVWGDGMTTRDFLYVYDAAMAFLQVGMRQGKPGLFCNVSTNEEVSIAAVAMKICTIFGIDYRERVVYENDKPKGQDRRRFLNWRIMDEIGWKPLVTLDDGLRHTVDYFVSRVCSA